MATTYPKTVLSAVFLIAATLLVGLVQTIRFLPTDLPLSPAITYGITSALYLALAALVYLIARGKDWARITYTAILVLGFLKAAATVSALLQAPQANLLPIAMYGAKIVALVLLYVPSSNAWFRHHGGSSNNSFKPKPLRGSA
ncbi:hypothetical protein J2X06_002925 [Lysobacter niastensis]|uniref:ATP synthase protein I n=1 Tax=Lysobacter niastensis TaxID=380629 RepID=A0ABU1WDM0_9GAMM|nr:hypothetical protein [Lysobacter niastensis]MDR7135716.1 hypothetical protein [Lysobacter niastensis]